MSLTDNISENLQAIGAGVSTAQQEAAAVDHAVEQIAARAVAAGFAGIAVGLTRVREVVGQIRARLTTVGAVLGEASRSIAAVPQQPSPQETISALTPVVAALSTIDSAVTAAAAGIEEARRLAATALQGGQPGPTLARCSNSAKPSRPSRPEEARRGTMSKRRWRKPGRSVTWETNDGRRHLPTARRP